MRSFRFDANFDPPAPMLPVHISGVAQHAPAVLLQMLVDTGADCSLIPVRLAKTLRLPIVDYLRIVGVGGTAQLVPVHAARMRVGPLRVLTRLAAFEDEALLGRELLNQLVFTHNGPQQVTQLPARTRR